MFASNPDEIYSKDPIAIVIFGVTGDLTRRKLMPAVYQLRLAGKLEMPLHLIGFARRDWTDGQLRQQIQEGLQEFSLSQPVDSKTVEELVEKAHYIQSTFEDDKGYKNLHSYLNKQKIKNVIFYLATPPDEYIAIIRNLGEAECNETSDGWTRIVVEKPYGVDLQTALQLEDEIHKVFKEEQIYRIDHYLGKETVQNILVLRFANGIFEPIWNRNFVDYVQITVAEMVGVGTRAGYYETSGVIRDMFQNHMLQLLTLTAMEAPVAFNADAVRDEKVKVLKALRPMRGRDAIINTYRAQYTSGSEGDHRVPGYKDEQGVNPNSLTETFMAACLHVDNWRWAGVPFYLRSGKRMPVHCTEVAIQFKQPPLSLFNWKNMSGNAPTVLSLNIQPNEGITLSFGAKAPNISNGIEPVKMNFNYEQTFGRHPPEAYEILLLDVIQGDATLFTRRDEVRFAWEFVSGILDAWKGYPVHNLPVYEAGTWGPPGVDDFIGRDEWSWRNTVEV